ncbi:MAG: aspartate/glutamate racemase family protein [Chloroflexi bacterium]|nr:aspartate/glutamate racemase family protein [Chloroflexota bacterium]
MKTIGLIGGMSWESSLEYYRIINETIKQKLGGFHSAKCLLYSVDFAEVEEMQKLGKWQDAAQIMIAAAQNLERGGADFIILCTNTMHKLADEIQANIHIPFLHIADATAKMIKIAGLNTIGLLGTRFTMEHDFYKGRLIEKFGFKILIPNDADRERIHQIIYTELCLGVVKPESREEYKKVIAKLIREGAQGIILGCTEIELLVHEEDSAVPLYPTTRIHAQTAVAYALGEL